MLLVEILIAESQNATKWFSENKMIDNPDKFQSVIIQKSKQTTTPTHFFTWKRRCRSRFIR